MANQDFYDASVSFSDNSDAWMRNTWEVYANRNDSHGIPATFNVGTFDTREEAEAMAAEIDNA